MLSFPDKEYYHPLDDEDLPVLYGNLTPENKNKPLLSYMSTNAKFPKVILPYPISIFASELRKSITMIYQMLVDESILGFMTLINPPMEDPFVRFDYCHFLSGMMDA